MCVVGRDDMKVLRFSTNHETNEFGVDMYRSLSITTRASTNIRAGAQKCPCGPPFLAPWLGAVARLPRFGALWRIIQGGIFPLITNATPEAAKNKFLSATSHCYCYLDVEKAGWCRGYMYRYMYM